MKTIKDHSVAFAWFGIIAAVAFAIAWIGAAALDTTWVFGEANLSVLGVSDTDAKYFFNYGCIITGVLVAIFGIGRTIKAQNYGYTVGGALLVITGLFLILVGIFTMDYGNGDIHKFVAVTMGIVALGAMCAIAAADWYNKREFLAGVSIVMVGLLVATYLSQPFATFESWAAVIAIVWFIIEGGCTIALDLNK